ncbi:MurR/RpiR family transcriptional regulator [Vagococcus fluvialis]|uniref:MurR/RpiR family transcriptional regulator n=1 Tax=Vagococcus fluvialis TaxID=2738 RepID=A0A7X6D8L9_9ENTE|nr:MurR/RpiR family transcriptional regulator [Vagococcus fluvialis]MDT2746152.1 MurR/RpiR family transcriptional regulator [Vagococcus fluvialis]NKC58371.1 MurR/RpiR family transcriptional regulator [Vagococcus fluvialis]NKC67488.1 MurR/RpiR family transcriptional regulator [Vagococcus fluvialis]NKD49397.1 MurR/RpiR family transcriptional regulator [Vagococcus fluvialis]UDM75094.1 MurR/RpiR family transcriptional regulator [Vagococcus fluvialis]
MTILEEIQNKFPTFSEKEKRIATYLLKNNDVISNINISTLAKETETSPATITRFAKKLNQDGFVDLKIQLSMLKNNRNMNEDLHSEVYHFYTKVIENTEKIVKKSDLEIAVNSIKLAPRIFIFGVGSSGLTALELTQRLLRMGLNVISTTDSHMMLITSAMAMKNDLVIGISASGETVEVNDAVMHAKENGANVLSITCFPESTLSKISDTSLIAYSSVFVDNKRFVNSQFAIMYQIDVISTMLLEDEKLNERMSQTIKVITRGNQHREIGKNDKT